MALKAQQEAFCQAYVADLKRNATRAAISANYSEKTAYSQASRLLKSVEVKARIRELEREALAEAGFEGEVLKAVVMRQIANVALSDVTDIVQISPGRDDSNREAVLDAIAEQNGGQRVLDFGEVLVAPTPSMTAEMTAAIKSIKVKTEKGHVVGIDVDMHDKLAALKLLAEVAGITKGDVPISGTLNLEFGGKKKMLALAKQMADEADFDAGAEEDEGSDYDSG